MQPWQTLKSAASSSAQQNDIVDKQIADALVQIHDHHDIINWTAGQMYGQGFRQVVPKLLYKNMEEVKTTFSEVSALRSADPLRARLLQNTTRALKSYLQATELVTKAIIIGQSSSKGWGAQPQDLFSRAGVLMDKFPQGYKNLVADVKQLLESSDQFKSSLPIKIKYWFKIIERPSGFSLGANSFARNPFQLFRVRSSKLADNLGFRSGDTIISLGDREFKPTGDIEEFKVLLKSYVGQKVEVKIKRNDKIQTIILNIPKTL